MAYTNKALISNYLQRDLTENEEAFLVILNRAIKLWIDRKLGSTFDSAVESTRYYDGGSNSIDLDYASNITNVVAVNTDNTDSYDYTDLTEYIALPVNEDIKTELVKRDGCFPSGVGNIKVTATFGEYAGGVPADIELAATILAAETINQGKQASAGGNVASESLEGHSITYDTTSSSFDGIATNNPNIQSILDSRREIFV